MNTRGASSVPIARSISECSPLQQGRTISAVSSGTRLMLRLPLRWSNKPEYPCSWYLCRNLCMLRTLMPAISAASI